MKIWIYCLLIFPFCLFGQDEESSGGIKLIPTFALTFNDIITFEDRFIVPGKLNDNIGTRVGLELILRESKYWIISIEPNLNYYKLGITNMEYNATTLGRREIDQKLYIGNFYEARLFLQFAITNKICFGKEQKYSFNVGLEFVNQFTHEWDYSQLLIKDTSNNGDISFRQFDEQQSNEVFKVFYGFKGNISLEARHLFQSPLGFEIGWGRNLGILDGLRFKIQQFFVKIKYQLN